MNVTFGVGMILVGMLMIVFPLLEIMGPITERLAAVGTSLRQAWPATRDDGLFDDEINELEGKP